MLNNRYIASIAVAASAIFASTAAFAHPKLLSSTPADKAEVAAPAKIELKFSENLSTQFSGANLVMTEMPGMSGHDAMKVAAKVAAGDDDYGSYGDSEDQDEWGESDDEDGRPTRRNKRNETYERKTNCYAEQ